MDNIYFKEGAAVNEVSDLLANEGYYVITTEASLSEITKTQCSRIGILKGIERRLQNRYAILARSDD